MQQFFKPTVIFIVAAAAIITVFDVWAVTHGMDATISWTLSTISHRFIAIQFLFGFLAGHLFGSGVVDK